MMLPPFVINGDGGSTNDYRVYPVGALAADTSGAYAAGNVAGVSNNSHAYYSAYGNIPAPAAQVVLFPQQTGNTNVGAQGESWHLWEIKKLGNIVTWRIDGTLIGTVDLTGKSPSGDNLFKLVAAESDGAPSRQNVPVILREEELPKTDQVVTHIVQLRYLDPRDAATAFQQIIPPHSYGKIVAVPNGRALVVTEASQTIRAILARAFTR